jgi:hypothetical protein
MELGKVQWVLLDPVFTVETEIQCCFDIYQSSKVVICENISQSLLTFTPFYDHPFQY